ncbi:unnamed protein product [Angiostrongylus costaricensis]|uniref:Uncharacterized protein n=1 Tax=Angiostrongylus costaricensis TaxID=334426 RepID=A0A158PK60_ANGCS|nr:unnamed protein product [Angiostrongylus costaricensis]
MPNEQNGYCGPHTSYTDVNIIDSGNMRYQRRPGEHLMRSSGGGVCVYTKPIPRVRAKYAVDQVDQYKDISSTVRHKQGVSRLDTFRENAIETVRNYNVLFTKVSIPVRKLSHLPVFFQIYDEFRFLDETDAPVSPASSANPIMKPTELVECGFRFTPSLIAYCLLPLIQLTISVGLLLLSVLRLQRSFREPLSTNSLVDFDKPEGFSPLDEGSSKTLRIRSAVSVLIPAVFQCIAAAAGFWPLVKRNRSYYQSDVVGMCLALGIALIAATVCCFSIYATSRSLTNVTQWRMSPAVASQPLLYSFALKEAIVASYALLAAVFFFVAAIQQNHGLILASSIIQT